MAMPSKPLSHDALVAKCWQYTWNKHAKTRKLCFHVTNECKPYPGETRTSHLARLNHQKAIGVVPGVMDLLFFWKGRLYAFDIKIDHDTLSPDQHAFIAAIRSQGGEGYEIRSFEQFCSIFDTIMYQNDTV